MYGSKRENNYATLTSKLTSILVTLLVTACSVTGTFNAKINKAQIKALDNSPFSTAEGMNMEVRIQKKFRSQYLTDLSDLINRNPPGIVMMTEFYSEICMACPADHVDIFLDSTRYTFELQGNVYNKSIRQLSPAYYDYDDEYHWSDIQELMTLVKDGNEWNKQPDNYGTDDCFDGGHTIYTVIHPNGDIESMYMRCWIHKHWRER